jgi:hypothetical protein
MAWETLPNGAHIDRCKPYQVRTGCGHIVTRMMREATAGVPYAPETILEAPNGRVCDGCAAKYPGIDSGVCNHPARLRVIKSERLDSN